MKFVGERLKKLRQKANLTQKELAEKIFKAESTISMWERGEREMDYEILVFFSNFFGVSTDYLLGITDNQYKTIANSNDDLSGFQIAMYEIDDLLSEEKKQLIINIAKELAEKK